LKILIQNTSHEFYDWVTEDIAIDMTYHRREKMESFNKEMGMKISMKAFNKWMNSYAKYIDCTYSTWRSGNDQSFYFKLEKLVRP
jgi:Fe-S cluster assembly scaffold protein SufB